MKTTAKMNKSDLEIELAHYNELSIQIKQLESEKERLKKSLINAYFEKNVVFKGKSFIATYMPQERTNFKNGDFKEVYPDLYDQFSVKQTIYIFSVKSQ